jgi:hypothetical protein
VPYLFDDAQKNHQRASETELLELLCGREAYDSDGIATSDELWFHYHHDPGEKFAASRVKLTPFVWAQLAVQKVMVIVFFRSTTRIASEALPKARKFK